MSHDDKVNELIERVRFICVKGGVRPEIMGALCHAIRYDDTNAAPREITAEVSSPVLGEFGEVPQSEGTHTHPVPTREANAARGAAPVVTHSAVAAQEAEAVIKELREQHFAGPLAMRAERLIRSLVTPSSVAATVGGREFTLEAALREIVEELEPEHLADHDDAQIGSHIEHAYGVAVQALAGFAPSATADSNALVEACRGLVSYWTRNLRNFQWEKADDHVKRINAALASATDSPTRTK